MIVDGKYIEPGSMPLDRLEEGVMTSQDAASAHSAINGRIDALENLTSPNNTALMQFKTNTVNHIGSTISAASGSPHTVGDNYITKAMLNSDLSGDIVYRTGTAQDVTSSKHFKGVTTQFSAANTNSVAVNISSGSTTMQSLSATSGSFSTTLSAAGNTNLGGTLTVAGATTINNALTVSSLKVTGKVELNTVVNSTTENTTIRDAMITLNQSGSNPGASNICGIEIYSSYNSSNKNPEIVYNGGGTSGWSVKKLNSTTYSPIAVLADIAAAGGQTATQVATAIKNAILTEVKKVILAGKGVNYTTTTATTLQGTAGRAITLPAGFASAAGDYAVFISVDGTSAPATIGNIGEIYVVNNSATKFTVYNSGSNAAATFTWVAINLTKWKAYGGINVF